MTAPGRPRAKLTIGEITAAVVSQSAARRASRAGEDGADRPTLQRLKQGNSDAELYQRLYDRTIEYQMRLGALRGAERRFRGCTAPEPLFRARNGAILNEKNQIVFERKPRPPPGKMTVVGRSTTVEQKGFDPDGFCRIEIVKATRNSQ